MNVNFYKFNKKINSTEIPSGTGTVISCELKSPSSIINPRLELSSYPDYNYCYIQRFNRYYFINNIEFRDGYWVVNLNVDVLASFKADIGNASKYILRSASNYDLAVKDTIYSDKSSFSINTQTYTGTKVSFSDGYYVVGVVGTQSNTGGSIYYRMTADQFTVLINNLFTTANGIGWGDLSQGVINSVMNPFQYISSVMWYPFQVGVGLGSETIKSGNWQTTATGTRLLGMSNGTSITSFSIPKHPQASTRGQYLNEKPFTKYRLEGAYFGILDLPNELLFNKTTLAIGRLDDFTTGISTLEVYATDSNNNTVSIAKIDTQTGVSIQISSDTSGVVNMIVGGVETVAGYGLGNIGTMVKGVSDVIGGGLSTLAPSISTKGTRGTVVNSLQDIKMSSIFYGVVDEDLTNLGRPLCQTKNINTLSGYVQCRDGFIQSNATEEEKSSISEYLTRGFYYE